MCGGEGTAMCGEPRVTAECTCTEREFGRCSRPTVRPGRTGHDARDHGDGSDTRPRGRRPSGSLTETRVRDWQYWPERFDVSADRTMNPCPLDGTDQLARHVLAACIEPDGPVDADGDQALIIDAMRATRPSCQVARRHGRGTRPPGRSCDGRDAAGLVTPPLPRSPPRPSLASCRCRCRRPRTVCVVPRERWGGTGGVSHERTRPGTGDPMSASGPPSVRW